MAFVVKPNIANDIMSCSGSVSGTQYMREPHTFPDKYSKTLTSDSEYIEKRKYSVNLPIFKSEYERIQFQNTRTPVKIRRMKNRNQHYRRIHNIKQPGRTNCTQRLF